MIQKARSLRLNGLIKLSLIFVLVLEFLITNDAFSQTAPVLKTHFFKPENIKQIRIVTPLDKMSTIYMMVYLDPPVNNDSALAWVIYCPCDVLQRTLELSQLAQMFEQGIIKGVAYSLAPGEDTLEMQSMYFDQPVNQKAFRIKGLFFSEPSRTQMLQPSGGAYIIPSQSVAPQIITKISGSWNSNIGVTYEIVQNGDIFSWTAASIGQKGNGTIKGKQINANWWDSKGQGSVTGTITEITPDGTAKAIHWNNGVFFKRP
jgi:hypothetical protein